MMKVMNDAFGEKNLLKMFGLEKCAGRHVVCGFSEFLDITENMLKELIEMSMITILDQPEDGQNSLDIFTVNIPVTPAQIDHIEEELSEFDKFEKAFLRMQAFNCCKIDDLVKSIEMAM